VELRQWRELGFNLLLAGHDGVLHYPRANTSHITSGYEMGGSLFVRPERWGPRLRGAVTATPPGLSTVQSWGINRDSSGGQSGRVSIGSVAQGRDAGLRRDRLAAIVNLARKTGRFPSSRKTAFFMSIILLTSFEKLTELGKPS
jgi:hypothetical protein